MKAVTTRGFGSSATLIIKEVNKPKIGAGDVLVKVHASSVNPKDWKLNYNISTLVPKVWCLSSFHIIGDDLAGVIIERGEDVTNFEVGDQVYGMDMRLRTAACAEYTCIAAKRIAHMPNNISFKEAASVPLAALTALQAFRLGKVDDTSKVLIIGASGGVGTFAIQIAKAMGADVSGVCSAKNIELVKNLGANKVIDYTKEDFKKDNNTFDLIFDVTAYESLTTCSSLMAEDGIFVSTAGNGKALFNAYRPYPFMGNKSAKAIWVESYTSDLEILKTFIESGSVTPVIDSVYPLANLEDAYTKNKTGRSRGKIVVQIV